MLHFSETAPFPCTPTPREQGKARPQNKKEQPVGLHFDFARRLPQSYILKLLDRARIRQLRQLSIFCRNEQELSASLGSGRCKQSNPREFGQRCTNRD
jgi:hypothetical protein